LQQGFFTFHVPILKGNGVVKNWKIPGTTAKAEIIKELEALNINDFTVYGDMDALGRYLSNVYKQVP
jgi:hypothetical protein